MTCTGNTHAWTNPFPSGEHCVCKQIYAPLRPFNEVVRIAKAGDVKEFPYGWTVTFPSQGKWQVTILPEEPATNHKSACQVMKL